MGMTATYPASCERWGLFEVSMPGKTEGNPFTDYEIKATFKGPQETVTVNGFYDGDGIYRVRFMPEFEGEYTFTVSGNFAEEGAEGSFTATAPSAGNHGPVRVCNQFHLAHEDGTPHYDCGTTVYSFALQKPEIVESTFAELSKGYFNKLRFCLMPKHYDFSLYDPVLFPYEGTPMDASVLTRRNFSDYGYGYYHGKKNPDNKFDCTRFNPAFFQLYDKAIMRLQEMGIEADMILFHAYDRWGFARMTNEENKLYIKYVTARYAAYRNIWWALANEYELISNQEAFWEDLAQVLVENDPYSHLRSIHNCEKFYNYGKSWITHCSCQRCDHHKTTEFTEDLRRQYGKPVIWDEVGYEGDFPHCWGNFTPEELVRRSWEAIVRGGYCGHSETFLADDGVIWWAHGGKLKGESAERFKFMQDFLMDVPGCGLKLGRLRDDYRWQWDDYVAVPQDEKYFGDYYFLYFSIWRPPFRQLWIDDENEYDVEVVDTLNMTITYAGRYKGRFEVPMSGKQYCGLRVKKVK